MPTAPPTACQCGGKRINNICDKCGPRKDVRRSSSERGYDSRWNTEREAHLRENPLCVCCLARGRVNGTRGRNGLRVDHIVPVRLAPHLMHEPSNWQTICLDCDLRHKMPCEQRCATPELVRAAWAKILDDMRMECTQDA